jgi:hypothetical protein
MSVIWKGITLRYQKELMDALKVGNEKRVHEFLRNYVGNKGSQGMEHSPDIYSSPDMTIDRSLLSDEELMIPSPPGQKMNTTMTGLVANMIYNLAGKVPRNVMEIGAGLGFMGVIMRRWGAQSYTDVDLPTNVLAAAYFVSRCNGEDQVFLYGEPSSENRFASFYPSTDCRGVLKRKYDAICNVNSFPEIPVHAQDDYLGIIAQCLSDDGFFLSVNHEETVLNQRSMSTAMQNQSKLKCVLGRSSQAYPGYIDEVYRIQR